MMNLASRATMHLNIAGAQVVLGKDKPLLRYESCKADFMQIVFSNILAANCMVWGRRTQVRNDAGPGTGL